MLALSKISNALSDLILSLSKILEMLVGDKILDAVL